MKLKIQKQFCYNLKTDYFEISRRQAPRCHGDHSSSRFPWRSCRWECFVCAFLPQGSGDPKEFREEELLKKSLGLIENNFLMIEDFDSIPFCANVLTTDPQTLPPKRQKFPKHKTSPNLDDVCVPVFNCEHQGGLSFVVLDLHHFFDRKNK